MFAFSYYFKKQTDEICVAYSTLSSLENYLCARLKYPSEIDSFE